MTPTDRFSHWASHQSLAGGLVPLAAVAATLGARKSNAHRSLRRSGLPSVLVWRTWRSPTTGALFRVRLRALKNQDAQSLVGEMLSRHQTQLGMPPALVRRLAARLRRRWHRP